MGVMRFLTKLFHGFSSSIKRFPVTLCFTTLFTVCLLILTELTMPSKALVRFTLVMALGIPSSLIIKLVFESIKPTMFIFKIVAYTLILGFLLIYYLYFLPSFDMVPVTRFIAVNFVLYLIALTIPFLSGKRHVEFYVVRLIEQFCITVVYAIVLSLGITAILGTLEALLGVFLYARVYLHIWILVGGLFAPIHFLSGIPMNVNNLSFQGFPQVLKILMLYIVLPLIAVYTAVLYLYFAKILITLQWPEGMIGNLVLWYTAFSTVVIFLIYPLEKESKWVKAFVTWFTRIVIPLIALMFISIGIRISAYGFTENRYFVIALGIWVLGSMLYLIFVKTRRNVILILSLAVIALVSVASPWNAYSVSIASQNSRFNKLLGKYGMLENSSLVEPKMPISLEDQRDINEILYYFQSNHTLFDIKKLPQHFTLDDMPKLFGFEYRSFYQDTYISYYLDRVGPILTTDFDYMFTINAPGEGSSQSAANIKVEYQTEQDKLFIYKDDAVIYILDFLSIVEKFQEYNSAQMNLPLEQMTFTSENDELKVKLILLNIFAQRKSVVNTKISSVGFYLFLQLK